MRGASMNKEILDLLAKIPDEKVRQEVLQVFEHYEQTLKEIAALADRMLEGK